VNRELHEFFRSKSMRTLLLLLTVGLVVSACIFVAACGEEETTTTTKAPATTTTTKAPATTTTAVPLPPTIKVGAAVPLTGKYSGLGGQIKPGYELAVATINATGGVMVGGTKIPLELTILDDESDATKNGQQMETLKSNGVVAYLGGAGSDLHAAAAGTAEKNKIPYLGIAFSLNSTHEQGFKYVFAPFPKSKDHAKACFDLLDSFTPKPTKVAIFQETTDGGKELKKYWDLEATARGYQNTTYEYAPGATDYASMITAARDAGAEVLLGYASEKDGTAILKQANELGWNAKVYVLIRAADPPTFGANLGVDSDGVYFLPGFNSALPYAGVADYAAAYLAANGKPAPPLSGAAYVCVQILADAITRAGSLDRTAIRDAIAATDLDTLVGHVKFAEDGTWIDAKDPVIMWQGGKQLLVFPPDVAKAPTIYPAVPWKDR
jgi:branched-chain amino acid transport system substrate-binding protein